MDKRAAGVYYQMRKTTSKYRDTCNEFSSSFKVAQNPLVPADLTTSKFFKTYRYGSLLNANRPSTS